MQRPGKLKQTHPAGQNCRLQMEQKQLNLDSRLSLCLAAVMLEHALQGQAIRGAG